MLKLLLCLSTSMILAVLILQLRQQKLELSHEVNQLHNAIEAQQSKLWNQQLQIAVVTAPNAIAQTVHTHDLKMVPRSPLPAQAAAWIDTGELNPDAEE
jgi:cell division protein FtsL